MDSSAVTSHVKQARRLRKPGTSGGGVSYGYHSAGKYMTYLTQGERRKIIIHAYPRKSAGLIVGYVIVLRRVLFAMFADVFCLAVCFGFTEKKGRNVKNTS